MTKKSSSQSNTNIYAGIIFFAICTIWDLVTSTMGLASAFGGLTTVANNPFTIILDLILKNSLAFFFSLIIAGAIVTLDFWLVNTIKNWASKDTITYFLLALWAPLKYYDFSTTFVGTARCFMSNLKSQNASVSEVFAIASSSPTGTEQILILTIVSVIIAASPIILAYLLNELK
jgi:hypothetical protein